MSERLRFTGKEVVSALQRLGFEVVRVRGSHHRLRHPDGRVTSVPVHGSETLGPGSKILRDVQLSADTLRGSH